MKTVIGSLIGVDENLHHTGRADPTPLGNCHADMAVRYLLGLPHPAPSGAGEEPESLPALVLEGRREMRMQLVRHQPGRSFLITVKDGEQDQPIDEMQAVYRLRLFIEHHGSETEHTAEIRLSPEIRAQIKDRETGLDEARRRRLKREAPRRTFRQRGSLLKLFRSYALVVDRKANAVFERKGENDHELLDLDGVRRADVDGIGEAGGCRVVVQFEAGKDDESVGRVRWTEEEAVEIAEAINDAIDLPEVRRKLLRYRRIARARGDGGSRP